MVLQTISSPLGHYLKISHWILITFIDYMPPARNNAAPAVENRWERFAVVFTLTLASSSKRALASTMRTRESSTHHHTIIMELYCEPTHLNELSLILLYSITNLKHCQRLSMPAHLRIVLRHLHGFYARYPAGIHT